MRGDVLKEEDNLSFTARYGYDRKTHRYMMLLGYPIRLCNWVMPEGDIVMNSIDDDITCKLCARKEGP